MLIKPMSKNLCFRVQGDIARLGPGIVGDYAYATMHRKPGELKEDCWRRLYAKEKIGSRPNKNDTSSQEFVRLMNAYDNHINLLKDQKSEKRPLITAKNIVKILANAH